MRSVHTHLELDTPAGVALLDLTPRLRELVAASGIANGLAMVTSRHTTTAITLNENEPRLLADAQAFFEKIAPAGNRYLHNDIHLRDCPPDEPQNAHAHLLAMLLGSSESVAVVDGGLDLGTWQSVLLVELDGPRRRSVSLRVIGE